MILNWLKTCGKETSFKSYLFTIAYNEICNLFRRRKYQQKFAAETMIENREASDVTEDQIDYQSVLQQVEMIIAKIIGGLGVGMASVLAPLYISEFSPPSIRGRLVALYQLSIVIDILLAYFSNWVLSVFAHASADTFVYSGLFRKIMISEVRRGMFGAEMIPSVLFIVLLLIIPESPRWLIRNGYKERGYCLLVKVSGKDVAGKEFEEINEAIVYEKGKFSGVPKKNGIDRAMAQPIT